jgi:transposase-like protein
MSSASREKQGRFSAEVRDRAIRLVQEQTPQYASQWAAITAIAGKLGCTKETLRRWVRDAERDAGLRPGPTRADEDRVRALEREVRELRRANEILRKASAFFAAAELDRHTR